MESNFLSQYRNHPIPNEYIELLGKVDVAAANGVVLSYTIGENDIYFFTTKKLLEEEGKPPFKNPRYARFSLFIEEEKAQQKRYKNYMRGVDIEKFYVEHFLKNGLNLVAVQDSLTIGTTEGAMLILNLHDGSMWLLYFDGYISLLSKSLKNFLQEAECCQISSVPKEEKDPFIEQNFSKAVARAGHHFRAKEYAYVVILLSQHEPLLSKKQLNMLNESRANQNTHAA
jgi:hypothetical protein